MVLPFLIQQLFSSNIPEKVQCFSQVAGKREQLYDITILNLGETNWISEHKARYSYCLLGECLRAYSLRSTL